MKTEMRRPRAESKTNPQRRNGWRAVGDALPVKITETRDSTEPSELLFWGIEESELVLRESAAKPRDLLERTARFGESIIVFAKRVPKGRENDPLVSQLVRSGTSVGANYCEADDPLSRKDYLKSIGICRKESKEAKFWLRMIATAEPNLKDVARPIWREAKELNLIFGSIHRKK